LKKVICRFIQNGKKLKMREAIQDVEIGFRQLEFAIKLLSYIELGKINPAEFDTDHLVRLGTGNLHFPSVNFQSNDALVRAAQVNVVIAFSATTLVLDQAFDAIGIKPDFRATDDDGKLRLLVYMVRCAYAHGFANPRWHVTNKNAGVLAVNVEGQTIRLDLPHLHGKVFEIEQIGGYENWYRIGNASRRLFSVAYAA
jgi:hypothetical protein